MPTLSYEAHPKTLQFESPADGVLRITIPVHYFLSRNAWKYQLTVIGIPPALAIAAAFIHRDWPFVGEAFAVGLCISIIWAAIVGLFMASGRPSIFIVATPDHLTVQRQFKRSVSVKTYTREQLRAVSATYYGNKSGWFVDVHSRFEWSAITERLLREDAEKIAERLRAILQLPQSPG